MVGEVAVEVKRLMDRTLCGRPVRTLLVDLRLRLSHASLFFSRFFSLPSPPLSPVSLVELIARREARGFNMVKESVKFVRQSTHVKEINTTNGISRDERKKKDRRRLYYKKSNKRDLRCPSLSIYYRVFRILYRVLLRKLL